MRRTSFRTALALALLAPGAALAQHFEAIDTVPPANTGRFPAYEGAEPPRPLELFVEAGVQHDNNIFRLSKDEDASAVLGTSHRADTVTRVGAGIRYDQRIIGRQRLRLEARGDQYNFDRFNELDHFDYGLLGEWDWEFTNDLSGTLGVERRRRLIDLAAIQRPVKDLITEDHAYATAAYLLGPHVRIRGGLDANNAEHDETTTALAEAGLADVRAHTVTGAAEYVTPLGNALGLEARRTFGNAPIQLVEGSVPVDNDFRETEVAAVLTWTASPQLHLTGRLGRTVRKHEQFSDRNFSGTTGRVTGDWMPLNKTGFEFSAYREPRTIVDVASSFVLVRGVTVGPRWAPREKLVLSALLLRERQDFAGDPATLVAGTEQRKEKVQGYRLGAAWEPARFTQISLGFDHGHRSSNLALRDYTYDIVMANLRIRF